MDIDNLLVWDRGSHMLPATDFQERWHRHAARPDHALCPVRLAARSLPAVADTTCCAGTAGKSTFRDTVVGRSGRHRDDCAVCRILVGGVGHADFGATLASALLAVRALCGVVIGRWPLT